MKFGNHTPSSVNQKRAQSPAAVFTRGLQTPGTQWKFVFPNGYGASVIDDGYGAEAGLYELGVLHGGRLTYDTPLTDDVLGWLTADDVVEALDKIEALPAEVSA